VDVRTLCELLRLDALHEVWTGEDQGRLAFRCAAYELIKFRDEQRELKAHIKTRYRGAGILRLDGRELFHPEKRGRWIELMPADRRHGLMLLYKLFDTAYTAWSAQLAEVVRLGRAYPEIERFMEVPGIGEIGAHLFSAIIEDPHRFAKASQLHRFCALGITSKSSDGKPLGYERLDRTGRRELKTISYHAWRTSIRPDQKEDAVRRFYLESKARTGTARHGRLNTQRKILKTLWTMWRNGTRFDPETFLHKPEPPSAGKRRRRRRPRARRRKG
jgi:transposase